MNHSESEDKAQNSPEQPSSDDPQLSAASPERTSQAEAVDTDAHKQDQSRFSLRRRGWVLTAGAIVLLVVSGGLGWRWWQTTNAQEAQSEGQPPGIPVRITQVRSSQTTESNEYVANFVARQVVALQPQTDGRVRQILVQEGARVRAGTPIIQLGPAEQVASVESNAATVEAAQADIGAARADVNAAQADVSSAQANVAAAQADENAARADVNNARAEVSAAVNSLRALEAQRRSDTATLEFNQAQLRRNTQLFREGAISRQSLDDFALQVRTAQAALAGTNANIRAQRSTIAQRQSTVAQRQSAVVQRQATVSQRQSTVTQTRAGVAQTEATTIQREKIVQQNRANTQRELARLDYYRVIAPFDGTISDILVDVGDFATNSTDLTTITQNQSLEVNVSIPIEQAPQLRIGLPVELINAQGQVIGTSRIAFIAPNVNNQTQSVLIRSFFNNAAGRIRTDQYTRARVIWEQRPGILVPATAITRLGGEAFVFVAESAPSQAPQAGGGQQAPPAQPQLVARQKPVELGTIQGNDYQVLKGLRPGERLITSGILQLRDGAAIAPES